MAWVFLGFFAIFGCIGLVILRFLWFPSGQFSEIPGIFRAIGSLIALTFVLIGFGVPISALIGMAKGGPAAAGDSSAGTDPASGGNAIAGYRCPNCGAALGDQPDVSPSGDAKCPYCRKWWNIHRTPA